MLQKIKIIFKSYSLLGLPLLSACILPFDFDDQKTQVKVVSYRGEAGLDGTGIGISLASGDIDGDGLGFVGDLIVGQELDFGSVASIPVRPQPTDPNDLRTHFLTQDASSLSGNQEDRDTRQYGISVLVQNLGGGTAQDGPELIVGSPTKANSAGNVVIFDGDSRVFTFGSVVARLEGTSQEPNFGQSIALGDLDGATDAGGQPDIFQTLAVGAPGQGNALGSVYLFRTENNANNEAVICDDGLPASLKIDDAAVSAALPGVTLGPTFGTQVAIGELGSFFGVPDDRAELVVTEPGANRMFIFSFQASAALCDPLQIDALNSIEIPLPDAPAGLAILDSGTLNARIAVGFPAAQAGAGEVQICDALLFIPSCVAVPNPTPAFERLGDFTLTGYGQVLISGDLNDDNADGLFDSNDPDDLMVGAPASTVAGVANAGAAFLVFADNANGGFLTGATQIQVLADLAPEADAALGTSLAIIGELSGDALREVAVGAPGAGAGKGEALFYLDVTTSDFTAP